jgi:hypothetical protein
MRADDDGFVNNPKKIQKVIGASDDAVKILLAKKFILVFDSGVIVIKHWRMHNYIQNDRYKETNYKDEKAQLIVDENKAYTQCIQDISKTETQVRLELELGKSKVSKDKDNKDSKFTFDLSRKTSFDTLSELYKKELYNSISVSGYSLTYESFERSCLANGYKYKNFWLAYQNWANRDYNKQKQSGVTDRNNLNGYKLDDENGEVDF